MFDRIIIFSVSNKLAVAIGVCALIIWGVYSMVQLPIDAVPDITDNQVQIITVSTSLASQEVERLITMPVEQVMASVPGVKTMRSISRFGLSVVTIVFDDDTDLYWARAQIDQRIVELQELIPKHIGIPGLAPISTGLGEIYQYTIQVDETHKGQYSPTDLRTVQDWIVRRRLLGTDGVADVSSFGGFVKQIEVAVNPLALQAVKLSVTDIVAAVNKNNANDGGAYIEKGPSVAYIRTEGMAHSVEDVASIAIGTTEMGTPLLLSDVAVVQESHAIRYGAMTKDNTGETVGGVVMMLKGANSSTTIDAVKERIAEIEKTLPAGLSIEPFLDRTKLVNRAITTVTTNLVEGALIVMFILVLFLGNLRAGLIVASVIPLSMLFAFGLMRAFGVSGNLMSLGAIDFGLIVDGAVIIVESVLHSLEKYRGSSRQETILNSVLGIRRSASFGEIIILMVYLPILTLVGIEGKMFKPMAQTVMFAVAGAFILSLTYVPMMTSLVFRKGLGRTLSIADKLMRGLHAAYAPARRYAVRYSKAALVAVAIAFAIAIVMFLNIGGEFIPTLDEGDFAVETRLVTGSSISETIRVATRASEILTTNFPEVKTVIGKVGTSEIPTDPMPMESCDLMIILKDKSEWTSAKTRDELAGKMEAALMEIPGVEFGFQQPIQMRFNELMTGAKQDVVVKVFGHNLAELTRTGEQIGNIVRQISGTQGVYVEPLTGLPQIVIEPNRRACAQLGVNVDEINRTVRTAFAGELAGNIYEEEKRFGIVVRLDSTMRTNTADVDRLFVTTRDGRQIPLGYVAEIKTMIGPNQVQREAGRRRLIVGFNTQGRDVESIVNELRERIDGNVTLSAGSYYTVGGQFQNLIEATQRLLIAVPVVLIIILFMLYATFKSIREALLVFTAIPLSAIGGIGALVIRDMPFSISAGIGFIALFGVAVLNGIVLVSAFHKARALHTTSLLRIIYYGTTERLRPVLTTALVASLGFLPMALSNGSGAEVQRPLATVVIGGIISSTFLTLIVLPILYLLLSKRRRFTSSVKHAVSVICITVMGIGTGTGIGISVGAGISAATGIGTGTVIAIALSSVNVAAQTHNDIPPTTSRIELRAAKPLSLNEAVQMARTQNAGLIAQQSDVQRAVSQRKGAVDFGRTNVTFTQGQVSSAARDNMFNLTQTIPFPTSIIAGVNFANANIHASEQQLATSARSVETLVARAYQSVLLALEQRMLIDSFLPHFAQTSKAARLKHTTGAGTLLEKLTAESRLASLQSHRKIVAAAIVQAEIDLSDLCGSAERITVTDSQLVALALPLQATLRPPIIALRERQLELADQKLSVANSAYAPNITLGYFNQSFVGTTLVNGLPRTYSIGNRFDGFSVGLDIPLWFVPLSAKNQEAEIQRSTAHQLLQKELQHVSHRGQSVMAQVEAQASVMQDVQNTLIPLANTMVAQALTAYHAGQIEYVETFNAYTTALEIRTSALQSIYDYNLAVIEYNSLVQR
ncbi:MAG: CusA/CzcA family heavy metal efflux RND transporter [Ignavibacteria bacterium]|nr:CusA/CzcA family heavy metal efflux RND transporter [Ignavibacteria bacterium]